MMLNILMTFAQYEREVITERIKDKVSAAKKRGMHCGGPVPIGYRSDPETKKTPCCSGRSGTRQKDF